MKQDSIDAEVINLRFIRPLDMDTILASIGKTGKLITIEEGWHQCGIGAEIMARVVETDTFYQLDQPMYRLTGADIPMPYAEEMEKLRKIRETEPGALGLQRSDSRCSNSSHMSKSTSATTSKDEEVVSQDFPDDDLKTPTVEELSFPGQKVSSWLYEKSHFPTKMYNKMGNVTRWVQCLKYRQSF